MVVVGEFINIRSISICNSVRINKSKRGLVFDSYFLQILQVLVQIDLVQNIYIDMITCPVIDVTIEARLVAVQR